MNVMKYNSFSLVECVIIFSLILLYVFPIYLRINILNRKNIYVNLFTLLLKWKCESQKVNLVCMFSLANVNGQVKILTFAPVNICSTAVSVQKLD